MADFYVYILASQSGDALYTGVTGNLVRRVYEHKYSSVPGHAKRDGIEKLVYYETYTSAHRAIQREKSIKRWPRSLQIRLIGQNNAQWRDLYDEIV